MEEKYFEIPVTLIDENGELQELKTYIAKGDEDSVRMRAAKTLESEFSGQDYDYDVINITKEQYQMPFLLSFFLNNCGHSSRALSASQGCSSSSHE